VIPDPNFAAYLQSNFPTCITGNVLDTTCLQIVSVGSVTVANSAIQDLTGIQYFDDLQSLDCHGNLLTSLPPLPASVNFLNINDNHFADPPVLPPSLGQFYCNNNLLTTLPTLPAGLNVLSCNGNNLDSLPSLVIGLTYLSASNNFLTSLPSLPNLLTDLIISYNEFTSLPSTLPLGLQTLICGNNLLTSLPPLPPNLKELRCSSNQLTSLPVVPATLTYLACAFNQLNSLPLIPVTLDTLSIHDNLFTEIPQFPGPAFSCAVDISNNSISCLPLLPDSISLLFCGTEIQCFPNIPTGAHFNNCGDTLPPICSGTSECLPYNVSGYAFEDLNNNCVFDAGEPPLAERIIEINSGQYYTSTDADGYYRFYVGSPGIYSLSQVNSNQGLWNLTCNGNLYSITVASSTDTFNNRNFPNQISAYCALPTVDVATAAQRLCFSSNTYSVNYCNQGTLTAFNTYILLEFDPEIIPLSSALPWASVNGNIYQFDVGTLAPGDCGSFIITDSVSCNAVIDQTACVKANIFPDSTCEPVSPLWDQSDLEVYGSCNAATDSIQFVVKNTGSGNMLNPGNVTIYEDDLLMSQSWVQLSSGDSEIVVIPATGKTYRLEAEQSVDHPGKSQPRTFVELCGPGPYSLNKIIPVMQDDKDQWVEIDCHLISGAYDPNEKSVQPSGVGPLHLVTPDDELDYIIRFQNTGNDTAFNVLIIDTLDANDLDIPSILPGSSSHPYAFSLIGNGVVKFAFDHIMLPDSNANESASHGFVKYKIRQKAGNAVGTVINNIASIYFDYNSPVSTDTAFVTIDQKSNIFPDVVYPVMSQENYSIAVSPNPFDQLIEYNIDGLSKKNFEVAIFDRAW
jgi:hypothetical protein